MNKAELECWKSTVEHQLEVKRHAEAFCRKLLDRANAHDGSKLTDPEFKGFVEYTPKLASCEYESKEYKEFRAALDKTLEAHYAKNRHHPEHFPNGIGGMNLLDIIEMFLDWSAATKRQHNGNLKQSIEKNIGRFELSPQLASIFMNSLDLFED